MICESRDGYSLSAPSRFPAPGFPFANPPAAPGNGYYWGISYEPDNPLRTEPFNAAEFIKDFNPYYRLSANRLKANRLGQRDREKDSGLFGGKPRSVETISYRLGNRSP